MSAKTDQTSLFTEDDITGPVTCLGLTFKTDSERREYFREELRKKLPELKTIEGFPIGSDEDIIALSDPPYYTFCPNPWLNDFIHYWDNGDNNKIDNKEPFTADVSEGKNEPIYSAHTYHTKVPYKAIMRYILHYTDPGDVILDGFAGTGMVGVAANMCGVDNALKELGYLVDGSRIIDNNKNIISTKGSRKVILNDLSPAATLISKHYNTPIQKEKLLNDFEEIINKVEKEIGWVYKTKHTVGSNKLYGRINYVIWSDVYTCPNCTKDIIFYKEAVDQEGNKVKDDFNCKNCGINLSKNNLERVFETKFDEVLQVNVKHAKQIPVKINYIYNNKYFTKELDDVDLDLINSINDYKITSEIPLNAIPDGLNTSQPMNSHGITHVHQFYFKRALIVLSKLYGEVNQRKNNASMKLILQSIVGTLVSKLVRYNMGNRGNGVLNGTLYVASMVAEPDVLKVLKGKLRDLTKVLFVENYNVISGVQSTNSLQLNENSVDYIFTDPPFGANINYSELNYIWESWINLHTNTKNEAIINSKQEKGIVEYQRLLESCFKKYYEVLKSGKWMTVEFSNSKASIWNAIREAIEKAGFVIANVSALDKKQGSFKAVTTTTAVKQDLVITAYKPLQENIEKMRNHQNTPESAWVFITQHLSKLPVVMDNNENLGMIVERTPRILFDRMIAYHVQNGLPVPISSAEFQNVLAEKFSMRDGMVFLDEQVIGYDKKKISKKEFIQMSWLITDETSAIEWIRQQLLNKPQTRQDLHPNFMKEIQHIAKHEILPELDALLEQNFLIYEGKEEVPSQIHGYLSSNYKDLRGLQKTDSKLKEKAKNRWYVPDPNKQADLERLREKSLLREFDSYKTEIEGNKKKLKQFRTEAIRTGFKKAWSEKDYEAIVNIGERLPEKVLQEDDKLLMYFDNAQIRLGV